MKARAHRSIGGLLVVVALPWWLASGPLRATPPAKAPENLAPQARASASSEFNASYLAKFATDGKIPSPMGKSDVGKAWAVRGVAAADFTLEWPEPVRIAEIVYYGRTGWAWRENWRDYEVYLDGAGGAVAKGRLKRGHGPQRIRLAKPANATKLVLKFLNSHGGPNTGASEIRVYSQSPPKAVLGKFVAPFPTPDEPYVARSAPPVKEAPELLARLKAGRMGFRDMLVIRRHHIRCTHVYTYHCEGQRDGGGLYVYRPSDDSLRELVASPKGQISGCDVSYDGRSILFSWRKGRTYQVYRIEADGTGLRQLTDGPGHNYDACWLPDGDVVFLSTRQPQAAYCFFTPVGILYRMRPDGSGQRCLSANYLNDFTPSVLNDGRIIYGRWEYVDRPAIPIQSLWTINPDGTGLSVFFGNRVLDPATFIEPQAIPGTGKVLCTLTGHNGSCRGAIGVIDPIHGNNAQASIRNITLDVRLRGVTVSSNGPRGPYQTPYPLDAEHYLVSYDGTILLRDYRATRQAVVLAPREGMGFYNPRPLRGRPLPPIRPSALPKTDGDWATLYLQDVYNGLEPHVARGEVKRICVVEELPRALIDSPGIRRPAFDYQRVAVSCGATYVPKKVWGFADVADDGSAHFRVPARRPVYFMALDAQGRAVQRMRSFTHLMPGEVQGCVGCHESRSETSRPRDLPRAAYGKVQELDPPEWGPIGFNYAAIVQPVLDRHCIRCHKPLTAPKGIDLTGDATDYFNVSYEMLARGQKIRSRRPGNEVSWDSPYTKWIPTYNGFEGNILQIAPRTWGSPASKLAEIVLSGHPDAKGAKRVRLPRADRQRVLTWIDLNVPYYGTAETAYPANQACRRQYPRDLDRTLADVARRRCASCHKPGAGHSAGIPGRRWTRIGNPRWNSFLVAPLARAAGGTEACGTTVFRTTDDADYRALLRTFEPVLKALRETPRMDMPGAKPAPCKTLGSR